MSRWGTALAGAAGAVANVGVQALDRQMQQADQIEAEQRAADMKLAMAERMSAMEEAQRLRAAERFAKMTGAAMEEDVPLEAPGIETTGIQSFSKDPAKAAQVEAQLQAIVNNPNASPKQKEEAALGLEVLAQQKAEQLDLNAKSVEGKTRKRTLAEARDVAMERTATTDVGAFIGGQSMWKNAMADERADKKDKAAASEKDADRTSREKIAGMHVEQRAASSAAETERKAAADEDRAKAAKARIEALAGGKGDKATALMKNYRFLTEEMGKSKEEAESILFMAKDSSELEKVFKLLNNDKFGELTPQSAYEKVRGISAAVAGGNAGGSKIRDWNPKTGKFE